MAKPITAPTASPLLTGIDQAIEAVEAQIAALGPAAAGQVRGGSAASGGSSLDDLEVFAQRLRQIKRWMEQDHNLLAVVDEHIGQQVKHVDQQRARTNLRLAFVTTIGGAILGWLLSAAAAPVQLFSHLAH